MLMKLSMKRDHIEEEGNNQYSKRIKRLIKQVEKEINVKDCKRTVILRRRLLQAILGLSLVILAVLLLFFMWNAAYSYLRIAEAEGNVYYFVTVAISAAAFFMAGVSFVVNLPRDIPALFAELSKEDKEFLTTWYFNKLEKPEKKEDKPLLKALIMMKCKQPDIDLVYKKNDSRFTEESLLKRLYE